MVEGAFPGILWDAEVTGALYVALGVLSRGEAEMGEPSGSVGSLALS